MIWDNLYHVINNMSPNTDIDEECVKKTCQIGYNLIRASDKYLTFRSGRCQRVGGVKASWTNESREVDFDGKFKRYNVFFYMGHVLQIEDNPCTHMFDSVKW